MIEPVSTPPKANAMVDQKIMSFRLVLGRNAAASIGVAEPTSISVNTFGTSKLSDDAIVKLIRAHFDLRPRGLIRMLDLKRPIYRKTAAYGHFGRTEREFTWERTDKAEELRAAV